jgi:hypothetical protein
VQTACGGSRNLEAFIVGILTGLLNGLNLFNFTEKD